MIPYFQALGESIESAWRKCSYNEAAFTDLVLDGLCREPPAKNVSVEDIVDWIFHPVQPFPQPEHDRLFGEPPVVLFQAPRFYVEALFWLSSTTDIHQHAFSGAFTVLAGSSVHSHWRFSSERVINSRMILGRLERISTEVLRCGDIRLIHSGEQLIHQLFHLETPSVTIVVRTYQDRNRLPQYKYLLPGLALDSDAAGGLLTRRLILLKGMAKGGIEGLRKYSLQVMKDADLETVYYVLSLLTRHNTDTNSLGEAYEEARHWHPVEVVNHLREVCEGERRIRSIVALRSKISDSNIRFLLALLMLLPNRASIFEAIQAEVANSEPLAVIESWLEGASGNQIGFDFNDINRIVFRGLVNGLNTEGLLQGLLAEYSRESVGAHSEGLLSHIKRIASMELFFPLFSESPLRQATLAVHPT